MMRIGTTEAAPPVRRGVYRHWKGNIYWVEGVVENQSLPKQILVIYALYDEPSGRLGPQWYAREVGEFLETVGTDRYPVPRFKFLRPTALPRAAL